MTEVDLPRSVDVQKNYYQRRQNKFQNGKGKCSDGDWKIIMVCSQSQLCLRTGKQQHQLEIS